MKIKSYPKLLLFFCMVLFIGNAGAQDLKRKGSLGTFITALTDSLAAKYEIILPSGVVVNKIIPNSTAESLKMKEGDVILKINGQSVSTVPDVLDIAQGFRENDPLEIEIVRNKKVERLKGTVVPKPKEISANAEVIYGQVPYEGGLLRSILYKPKTGENFPTVFYLQGFDCSSIDQYYNAESVIRKLVDGWVDNGFAVYRVEKPGVGDSQGTKNCIDLNYTEEMAAFHSAYKTLESYDFVDTKNIFLFGHSLGGLAAPQLAVKYNPKGIIVYGTVLKSWFEYMVDIMREQAEIQQDDYLSIDENTREMIPFLYNLLVLKKSPEAMKKDPDLKRLLDNGALGFSDDKYFLGRHYTFWQGLQDLTLTKDWRAAGVHTLAIYGEHDIQAISPESAQTIANIVNAYHPGKGTFILLPGTEHGLVKVPSMKIYQAMLNSGKFNDQYMAENFNYEIVTLTSQWMAEKVKLAG